jgi:hypothetical protein
MKYGGDLVCFERKVSGMQLGAQIKSRHATVSGLYRAKMMIEDYYEK